MWTKINHCRSSMKYVNKKTITILKIEIGLLFLEHKQAVN